MTKIKSADFFSQGPAESAAEDCKGAVMAAKKANVHAEPRTVGYQFATAKVLNPVTRVSDQRPVCHCQGAGRSKLGVSLGGA